MSKYNLTLNGEPKTKKEGEEEEEEESEEEETDKPLKEKLWIELKMPIKNFDKRILSDTGRCLGKARTMILYLND